MIHPKVYGLVYGDNATGTIPHLVKHLWWVGEIRGRAPAILEDMALLLPAISLYSVQLYEEKDYIENFQK